MDDLAAVNKLRVIPVEWNAYARAPFVYWELSVVDKDGNGTVVTGDPGALEFSRVEFEVQGLPGASVPPHKSEGGIGCLLLLPTPRYHFSLSAQ